MLATPGNIAYEALKTNIRRAQARIPMKWETPFFRDGGIFPRINPKFTIPPGAKIFTVGSCFARNIEAVLVTLGYDVPVLRFALEGPEIALPASHILNEYNAGTTMQRLESVAGLFSYTPEMGIEETKDGFVDLFLHVATLPIGYDRLLRRRQDIAALYREMLTSDVVILTMGLVEAWFDTKHQCYLNKAPSKSHVRDEPGRFEHRRFDVDDVVSRMSRGIEIMLEMGVKNILLTVSPVPMEATFTPDGSVQANSYSKAVLRVASDMLAKKYPRVDYFPSYEIVTSFGTQGYADCNVHVKDNIIEDVTRYMAENYAEVLVAETAA